MITEHLVKRGFLDYFNEMHKEISSSLITSELSLPDKEEAIESNRTWFAGFAAGLHEAGVISGDTLDYLTNEISKKDK